MGSTAGGGKFQTLPSDDLRGSANTKFAIKQLTHVSLASGGNHMEAGTRA